ncbi:MAG: PAS domain S-box protein, partial [Nitrospirota bacterium]
KDITSRWKAEIEMRLHSEIVANMCEGVNLVRASDHLIVYTNPKFDKMFGYAHNELMEKHISVVNSPAGKGHLTTANEIIDALNVNSTWEGEIKNARKDGTNFWSYASVTVFDHDHHGKVYLAVHTDITERKKIEYRIQLINRLMEDLISPGIIDDKLKRITDGIVDIFDADFARIWVSRPGDLCDYGCFHSHVQDGPHVCRSRDKCLHLIASSGRYTHIDGEVHRRVPFGCYKIGHIASGEMTSFITNDVTNDPNVHDHDWAVRTGLRSFAGYRLVSEDRQPVGVLALFSKHPISASNVLLEGIANAAAHVIQTAKAEEALRESEMRYRDLFENANDLIQSVLPDGRFKYVNTTWEKALGYSMEEVGSFSIFSILHPDHRAHYRSLLESVMIGEKIDRIETVFVSKDGKCVIVEGSLNCKFEGGKPASIRSIFRDITERKKAEMDIQDAREALKAKVKERTAELESVIELLRIEIHERRNIEEALKQKNLELNSFINNIPDMAWLSDVNSRFIAANKAFAEAVGMETASLINQTYDNCFENEKAIKYREDDIKIMENKIQKIFEDKIVNNENKTVWLETIKSPILDGHGKVVGTVGVARDITERRKTVQKLRKAENQLRDHSKELQESNIALKVLLKQRENDTKAFEKNILSNMKHLVIPYLTKLKRNRATSEELTYLNIIESNLKEMISPFAHKLSSRYLDFTPKEIQIADLIKDGKKDKDIMEVLHISPDTIKTHRKNIRKKLGIQGKNINLRTKLLSL